MAGGAGPLVQGRARRAVRAAGLRSHVRHSHHHQPCTAHCPVGNFVPQRAWPFSATLIEPANVDRSRVAAN
jgi:hypothetical protein